MIFPKLSKREKLILYVMVGVIVFVSVDRLVFFPVTSILDNLIIQMVTYEKRLANSMRILQEEDRITKKYRVDMKSLKKIVSHEEEMAMLSSELEKLARRTSVLIKNMKPLKTEEFDLYSEYRVDIDAEAEMPYLMDFMYQLEKSPELLKVNKINLTRKKKESAVLKVSLSITKILFN